MTQAETTLGVVIFPSREEEEQGGGTEPHKGRDEDSSTSEGTYSALHISF